MKLQSSEKNRSNRSIALPDFFEWAYFDQKSTPCFPETGLGPRSETLGITCRKVSYPGFHVVPGSTDIKAWLRGL